MYGATASHRDEVLFVALAVYRICMRYGGRMSHLNRGSAIFCVAVARRGASDLVPESDRNLWSRKCPG
jgi:hypothetical protein